MRQDRSGSGGGSWRIRQRSRARAVECSHVADGADLYRNLVRIAAHHSAAPGREGGACTHIGPSRDPPPSQASYRGNATAAGAVARAEQSSTAIASHSEGQSATDSARPGSGARCTAPGGVAAWSRRAVVHRDSIGRSCVATHQFTRRQVARWR